MLFVTKGYQKLILLIDIQSSAVRGSLVLEVEDSLPEIIFSEESSIKFKPHVNSSYLIKTTLKAIEDITRSVNGFINTNHSDLGVHSISAVHYILSSPWIISQAKTISVNFEKDTKIDNKFILKIIEEERLKFIPNNSDAYTVMEEKIFDVKLNGYSVSDWQNKESKKAEVSFVVSVAGKKMLDIFIKSLKHVVDAKHVSFHSSLLLQHIGIQSIISNSNNYMLVHIHGELTDVGIINNRVCTFFGSFPFGVRNIVRKIASSRKITPQAADSLLTLYTANSLDLSHGKEDIQSIVQIKRGWISDLEKIIKNNTDTSSKIWRVILSSCEHDKFFADCFKEAFPNSKIESLSQDDVSKHVLYGEHAVHAKLPGLYTIAIHNIGIEQ